MALAGAAIVAVLAISVRPTEAQAPTGKDGKFAPGQGKGKGKGKAPSRPTPHWPDGHVNLGPLAGEKGVWSGSAGATLAKNPGGRGLDSPANHPSNLSFEEVPFQPWSRALFAYRQATLTKDDPHVRCKPSGGPRMFHTHYGMEFVDMPELKRVYIF